MNDELLLLAVAGWFIGIPFLLFIIMIALSGWFDD